MNWAKRVCLGVAELIVLLLVVGFVYEHIARAIVLVRPRLRRGSGLDPSYLTR